MSTFPCELLSTRGVAFQGDVESVGVPGVQGSFSVLKNHAPIISSLEFGIIKIKQSGQDQYFVCDAGVIEVEHDGRTSVLCNIIEPAGSSEEAKSKLKDLQTETMAS